MADRVIMLEGRGARGESFGDIARRTGSYDATPTDTDAAVLDKFAEYAIEQNPGFQGAKGDPGSPGEGYATRAALATAGNTATAGDDAYLTEGLRSGKFIFRTGNVSAQVTADPGQGIYIAKASDSSGATGAWVRQFEGPLYLEWFGAIGDNIANDRTPVLNARATAIAFSMRISRSGSQTYYVGATLTDLSGVEIVPGTSTVPMFRGSIDLGQQIYAADTLPVRPDASGTAYFYKVPRRRDFVEKGLWISEGDVTRITGNRIDCTSGMAYQQVAWPSGDIWTSSTPASTTADAWEANANTGSVWYGAFRRARAGQTISATFEAGSYQRGAFMRWSGGYVLLHGSGTSPQVTVKNTGSAKITSDITWSGLSDHPQWSLDNAEWGLRIYDLTTVGFILNGYEVYRATVQGIVHDIGLAVFASGSAVTPAVSWWSETFSDFFAGQQSLSLAFFGDSTISDFAGGLQENLREAIDFSKHGVRVNGWENWAVPNTNTLDVKNSFDAHGVGIANVVVIAAGTNDIQGGSPLSASLSNLEYVLDGVIGAGRKPLVVIPGLWLNSDQGAEGFATSNAEKGAPLRAAFRSLALRKGALVYEVSPREGQILEGYYADSSISSARKRDRIHQDELNYRAEGEGIASVILGYLARKVSYRLMPFVLPSAYLANGWALAAEQAALEVSEDGYLSLSGPLIAGTKADGTTILTLPPSLRPARVRRFLCNASATTTVRVEISLAGDVKVYGLQAGDSYLVLDSIGFQLP